MGVTRRGKGSTLGRKRKWGRHTKKGASPITPRVKKASTSTPSYDEDQLRSEDGSNSVLSEIPNEVSLSSVSSTSCISNLPSEHADHHIMSTSSGFDDEDTKRKLKRARNRRYRNSLFGLRSINKAKEKYRAKFANQNMLKGDEKAEVRRRQINAASRKYRKTMWGREKKRILSFAYRNSEKGRQSYLAAWNAYRSRKDGGKRCRAAYNAYRTTKDGRKRCREAWNAYRTTEDGGKRCRAAYNAYRATEDGRKRCRAAYNAYRATEDGRKRCRLASTTYQSTFKGRESLKKSYSAYRQTNKGKSINIKTSEKYYHNAKKKVSQSKRKTYKKSKAFQHFKKNEDGFEFERHFDEKRRKATDRIRTKKFVKSRGRLEFKLAASMILKDAMVDSLVKDIEDLLFPNLPLKGKSLSFKKSFFSTQLVDRILAVRDLWIRCIYANTYRLAGASESLLAQFCLDSNEGEQENCDKILGWRCHTKGSEPYFPKFSSKNGKHYLFKKSESAKKSATDEGGEKHYHACNENCILATKDELIRVSKLLKSASSLDVRQCRKAIQFADACRNDPEKMEVVYRLIVAKRNHPEACHLPDTACSSPLLLLRQLSVHYKGARELYRMANMMKIADQFLSDIDTATALGDIPYLLKLIAYKPPVAPKTFSVERPDELINGTTMAEKYGEHLVQFFNKNPKEGNEDNVLEEFLCETLDVEEGSVHNSGYSSSFPDTDRNTVTPPNLSGNGDRTEINENGFSEVYNTESEDGSGLTEGDSDILCLDNPEYIIANKRNRDPTEGNDNSSWEELLCESSDSFNSSICSVKDDPTLSKKPFGKQRQFYYENNIDKESVHNTEYGSSFPDGDTVTPPNLIGNGDRTKTNVNGFSEIYNTESEDGSGLTEGDSDIVCLDNPEYIIANKRNKDPTEGIANSSWEELLCESSDSFNSSICSVKDDPTLSKKPLGKQRQFDSKNKGGKPDDGFAHFAASEEFSFHDLGEVHEHILFPRLWKEAALCDINSLESKCIESGTKEQFDDERRKQVTAMVSH
ncbi:hypothetical protein ACHWQZ_G009944 [Mnemiopsis leidyi]